MFSRRDTEVLRKAALQVKEAARRDNSEEKTAFRKRHTSLKGERPAVFVFPDSSYGELILRDTTTVRKEPERFTQ